MRPSILAALAALLPALLPAAAGAHMTLETDQAAARSYWKAMPRVPHGCDGQATEAAEVAMPEPMPNPGWALASETGPYARPYDNHGGTLTEGVRAIRWTGGAPPDAHHDEFVFRGLPAEGLVAGTLLPVIAVQRCAAAEVRWDETPAAGQDPHGLERPGPLLRVAPPAPTGHDVLAGAAGHGGMAGSATVGDLTIRAPSPAPRSATRRPRPPT